MVDDLIFEIDRLINKLSGGDNRTYLISRIQSVGETVRNKWPDPVGQTVYKTHQQMELELLRIEKRRIKLMSDMEKIAEELKRMIDEDDFANKQKTMKMYDNGYPSYPGHGSRKR